jgi:hypothetical protein
LTVYLLVDDVVFLVWTLEVRCPKRAFMQTRHRLWRFRDLRAVSPGARPPADGVPVRCAASEWKGALPLPNLPRSTCAVGLRPAVAAAPIGTGPESGAVPRGHQFQRAIRFHLSRERDCLSDLVCRAVLVRQTFAHSGDGRTRHRRHDRMQVCKSACLHGRLCPSLDR